MIKKQKILIASSVSLMIIAFLMYLHVLTLWDWWAWNSYTTDMVDYYTFLNYVEGLDEMYPVIFLLLFASCVLNGAFIFINKIKLMIVPAIIQIISFLIGLGYYFHGNSLANESSGFATRANMVGGEVTFFPVLWMLAIIIPSFIIIFFSRRL